jgi:4,5-dihydroxyphthalate decarboxylase
MDVQWFTGQIPNEQSGEIPFVPPSELSVSIIEPTTSIDEMLLKGEIDAYINVTRPSPELFADGSGVKRLFDDPRAEGIRYYRRTGIYPTNHCMVVKREVVDRHPWVPLSIYRACLISNLQSLVSPTVLASYIETGLLQSDIQEVLSHNLFGYGIESESEILETFGQYCSEQGYTAKYLRPSEVFSHAYWNE